MVLTWFSRHRLAPGWVSTAPAPFPVPTKVNTATGSLSSERCVCGSINKLLQRSHFRSGESVWQNESTVVPPAFCVSILRVGLKMASRSGMGRRDHVANAQHDSKLTRNCQKQKQRGCQEFQINRRTTRSFFRITPKITAPNGSFGY